MALESISDGLDDPNVRVARKLSLFQRAAKICGMKRNQEQLGYSQDTLDVFESREDWMEIDETPKVSIQGRMMAKDNQPGKTRPTLEIFTAKTVKISCFPFQGLNPLLSIVTGLRVSFARSRSMCGSITRI